MFRIEFDFARVSVLFNETNGMFKGIVELNICKYNSLKSSNSIYKALISLFLLSVYILFPYFSLFISKSAKIEIP